MFGYKCEECHQGMVRPTVVHDFETRFENVPFTVPEAVIGVCDHCGARNFSAREYKRWKELFQRWREEREQVMSAAGIRQLRSDLGLGKSDFAALLGTTRQSLHHWEKDDREVPQSRMVDNLLRLLRKSCDERHVDVVSALYRLATQSGVSVASPHCEWLAAGTADRYSPSGSRAGRFRDPGDFGKLYPLPTSQAVLSPVLHVVVPEKRQSAKTAQGYLQ